MTAGSQQMVAISIMSLEAHLESLQEILSGY
jgi:hypothetical protein